MEKHTLTSNDPLLCTLHSSDANHQAANLINWQQEYDQLGQGRFLGVINEINFPHMHVFREDTNRGLRQQCRVEQGGLWLGFSANNKSCRINNKQATNNQFLCRPGSKDFELLTPDEFSIFGLVLHKSLFTQGTDQHEQILINQTCDDLWLENISPRTLMMFREYLSLLLQPEGNRWSSDTQEVILKDAVLDLFSQAQPVSPVHQVASHQRQHIMKRVRSYLTESRLKSPVTISEICDAVHVSRRTLQYTFTQCCDMSPKQYIQITRLNQVRRALLNDTDNQTIADIAFDHGFFHLGQFSQDYKRLFGEKPNQTRQSENE
ncbi:helix-turn-helix domain-containing protein [Vibrio algarum]|uniref:Helix-turn-helix domain-containing protein n=1 Tax=Vibrio algarum TaxID=3020714 RepID=A0ABT4YVR9_9VIBR|nr:helix-turn-helix domain-containing protein [Vibrio sp. KJ40-1]MDB1125679.1 helix-turn-helix domain-containing protein [Vibrio sp. KJ40-1]